MATDDEFFEEGLVSLSDMEIPLPLPGEVIENILKDIDKSIDEADKRIKEALEAKNLRYKGEVFEVSVKTSYFDNSKIFGIDGTYNIANNILFDIIFVGAIGISQDKLFFDFVKLITPPSPLSGRVAQGLMTYLEMKIAYHLIVNNMADLIIWDGSFLSLLTRINSFYSANSEHPGDVIWVSKFNRGSNIPGITTGILNDFFSSKNEMYRDWYSTILNSDKIIAVPKRMTSAIFLKRRQPNLMKHYSDGSFFSMYLRPGQLVYEQIKTLDPEIDKQTNLASRHPYRPPDADIVENFYDREGFLFVYYKPKPWSHALKIEFPANQKVIDSMNQSINKNRFLATLATINEQMITPYIREPFIKYLAHLYCKQFIAGAKAFKDAILNEISKKWMKKFPNIPYFALGYRSY